LLGEQARARSIAEPALRQQRELEPRVLGAGDADIGRCEQDPSSEISSEVFLSRMFAFVGLFSVT
jgi:hypothetical protein